MSKMTYIAFQQRYLSQINTSQTGFEACFVSKRSDLNIRNILMY